jgi:tetratricopeptide (TPR) repeat protein
LPRYKAAYSFAPFLLLAGKSREYEELCKRVVNELPDSPDAFEAEIAVRYCALHPTAAGLAERVVTMVEALARGGAWKGFEQAGLACCRAGRYEQAIQWLEKARQAAPTTDYDVGASVVWLDLAIVHHHLGRPKEAREWLDKARELLGRNLLVGKYQVSDRMELAVLRREAESLILGDKEKDKSKPPTDAGNGMSGAPCALKFGRQPRFRVAFGRAERDPLTSAHWLTSKGTSFIPKGCNSKAQGRHQRRGEGARPGSDPWPDLRRRFLHRFRAIWQYAAENSGQQRDGRLRRQND